MAGLACRVSIVLGKGGRVHRLISLQGMSSHGGPRACSESETKQERYQVSVCVYLGGFRGIG